MPRMARVVVPGYPHHLTQRGNRRQPSQVGRALPDNLAGGARPTDYRAYREQMAEWCGRCGVEMNPVRARMVDRPQAYRWRSASAHLAGRDDVLVKAAPLLDIAAGSASGRAARPD